MNIFDVLYSVIATFSGTCSSNEDQLLGAVNICPKFPTLKRSPSLLNHYFSCEFYSMKNGPILTILDIIDT